MWGTETLYIPLCKAGFNILDGEYCIKKKQNCIKNCIKKQLTPGIEVYCLS